MNKRKGKITLVPGYPELTRRLRRSRSAVTLGVSVLIITMFYGLLMPDADNKLVLGMGACGAGIIFCAVIVYRVTYRQAEKVMHESIKYIA